MGFSELLLFVVAVELLFVVRSLREMGKSLLAIHRMIHSKVYPETPIS